MSAQDRCPVTLPNPLRHSGRRLLQAALLAVLLLPGAPARADVIDFDPETDTVPEILGAADRARLDALTGARFVYMISPLSPGGDHVLAFHGRGVGFIDLATGEITDLEGEPPGDQATQSTWLDDHTVAQIHVEVIEPEDGPPEVHYYKVAIDARSGAIEATEIDLSTLGGGLVDASPDLETFLVVEFPTGPDPAPPIEVRMGPPYDRPGRDVPEDLPGIVGAHPLGTIELQQSDIRLVLVDADGTNRRELLALPPQSGLAGLSWSAESTALAITTRTIPGWQDARPRDSDPPGAGVPFLGSINTREALGLVPPDENPLLTGTRMAVFDVTAGDELAALDNRDYPAGVLAGLELTPSGDRALVTVATRSDLVGRTHPTYANPSGLQWLIIDLATAETKVTPIAVPGADQLSAYATWAGEWSIVFTIPHELDTRIAIHEWETGTTTSAWDHPGSSFQVLTTPTGRIVHSHATFDRPTELWLGAPEEHLATHEEGNPPSWRQVTALNTATARASRLRWTDVSWTTSDGETLSGAIVHHELQSFPPAEPMPLVVWQMGGPGGQMVNDFGTSVESPYSLLPNFGVPVLVANAAGRAIQGPEFVKAMADGTNYGQLDIAQVKEGVERLTELGWVDPDRVGITGCSYGGYFTLQSLRTYPGFYAAGNPQCSLVDLTEEFTFGFTPVVSYIMGRTPFADPEEYVRDSPLYGTREITEPTLIFHGTQDFLPVALINNVHDQIEANGVPVRFLRVALEGHGFGHPDSQAYAGQMQLEFFREQLGVGPFRTPTIYLPITRRHPES